jgi:putative aminopeptidase FrvX
MPRFDAVSFHPWEHPMNKDAYEFLKAMQQTPSPSGFEQPVQRIVRQRMKPYADEIRTDVHGNVIAALNPKGAPRVMLAGHCDQIGMMIKYINDEGFLAFAAIGGIDAAVLPGLRVTVYGKRGPVNGVIGRKPIHLMRDRNAEPPPKIDINELWIDIGAKNRKAAERFVAVGNPVTFKLGMDALDGDLVTSPGFDNKIGVFVVMEALRLAAARKLKCALYAVSTVQEEVGLRGARTACYGIDPLVGIAVDVTHASDCPGIEKNRVGDIKIGAGPVIEIGANINPIVAERFRQTARRRKIPHQMSGSPGATGTDASAIQISRAGVAAGLISVPNRYMHTPVEVVSLTDLVNAANLIAETVLQIDDKTDFVPN